MEETPSFAGTVVAALKRRYQHMLDRTVVYMWSRWIAFALFLVLYCIRVYTAQGWFIVTYGLGIFLLNIFIGFISPKVDPETEGPVLPTKNSEEFRPFTRRVPEFTFWYSAMRATVIAFVMTFFSVFNVPVFWPILLIYFITLFALTMKNQIAHMIKYRYIPISLGKKQYAAAAAAVAGGKDKPAEPRFSGSNLRD